MIVTAVMAALATELDKIAGLRVYDHAASNVAPPFAVVLPPQSITYDLSGGRGQDQMDISVAVCAGMVSDRTVLDVLGPYADGTGSSSVKAILEAHNGSYTAFSRVRVRQVDFDTVTVSAVEYLGAIFALDVYGTGD